MEAKTVDEPIITLAISRFLSLRPDQCMAMIRRSKLAWALPVCLLWSLLFLYKSSQRVSRSDNLGRASWIDLETFVRTTVTATIFNTTATTSIETASQTQSDDDLSSCFHLNSKAWLHGPRLGNVADSNLLDSMDIFSDAAPHDSSTNKPSFLQNLLDQSICADQSRFKNMRDISTATFQNATLKAWTIRLVYWSMHYHQTRHAQAEARHRYHVQHAKGISCSSQVTQHSHTPGPYDYECSNATFIVASLADVGLGANVRGGMVYGYLAALLANRVVLFVNDAPTGHKFLRKPWALVSCRDDTADIGNTTTRRRRRRRDVQCFFRPSSPCVLTESDIEKAYPLSTRETQQLMRSGTQPSGHEHDKVWFMRLGFTPLVATPPLAAERLRMYAYQLIQEHFSRSDDASQNEPTLQTMLYQAADNIVSSDEPRHGYNYGAANVKVHHALVVYAMRPRKDKAIQMNRQLAELITRHQINPELSFGLPIRASDKCDRESECLTFQQHMQATQIVWEGFQKRGMLPQAAKASPPSIIFTTESSSMLNEQLNFSASHPSFPFRIASNNFDVTPDTGFIAHAAKSLNADDSLLSAMTSLQFQLLARATLGNCCSNFHTMLADLLAAGCGAASENDFYCFQEMEDPALRICCGWFKDCKENKLRDAMAWTANVSKPLL